MIIVAITLRLPLDGDGLMLDRHYRRRLLAEASSHSPPRRAFPSDGSFMTESRAARHIFALAAFMLQPDKSIYMAMRLIIYYSFLDEARRP